MKRLIPYMYIVLNKCLIPATKVKRIIASCDRINDSNLLVDTDTELSEIKKHNSKLVKEYLIRYATDKGAFGGIYYEKDPADGKVHLFVVEFFIFQNVPTTQGKITEYNDYIAAIASAISDKGKVEKYRYIQVFTAQADKGREDLSKYRKNLQIEGLWLELLDSTNYTSAYNEAKGKID